MAFVAKLRCIYANETHAAPVSQAQCIAIQHPCDISLSKLAVSSAERRSRQAQDCGYKKGAH